MDIKNINIMFIILILLILLVILCCVLKNNIFDYKIDTFYTLTQRTQNIPVVKTLSILKVRYGCFDSHRLSDEEYNAAGGVISTTSAYSAMKTQIEYYENENKIDIDLKPGYTGKNVNCGFGRFGNTLEDKGIIDSIKLEDNDILKINFFKKTDQTFLAGCSNNCSNSYMYIYLEKTFEDYFLHGCGKIDCSPIFTGDDNFGVALYNNKGMEIPLGKLKNWDRIEPIIIYTYVKNNSDQKIENLYKFDFTDINNQGPIFTWPHNWMRYFLNIPHTFKTGRTGVCPNTSNFSDRLKQSGRETECEFGNEFEIHYKYGNGDPKIIVWQGRKPKNFTLTEEIYNNSPKKIIVSRKGKNAYIFDKSIPSDIKMLGDNTLSARLYGNETILYTNKNDIGFVGNNEWFRVKSYGIDPKKSVSVGEYNLILDTSGEYLKINTLDGEGYFNVFVKSTPIKFIFIINNKNKIGLSEVKAIRYGKKDAEQAAAAGMNPNLEEHGTFIPALSIEMETVVKGKPSFVSLSKLSDNNYDINQVVDKGKWLRLIYPSGVEIDHVELNVSTSKSKYSVYNLKDTHIVIGQSLTPPKSLEEAIKYSNKKMVKKGIFKVDEANEKLFFPTPEEFYISSKFKMIPHLTDGDELSGTDYVDNGRCAPGVREATCPTCFGNKYYEKVEPSDDDINSNSVTAADEYFKKNCLEDKKCLYITTESSKRSQYVYGRRINYYNYYGYKFTDDDKNVTNNDYNPLTIYTGEYLKDENGNRRGFTDYYSTPGFDITLLEKDIHNPNSEKYRDDTSCKVALIPTYKKSFWGIGAGHVTRKTYKKVKK